MAIEKDNRKFAIYSRKSKFTGKGESVANQIELCRQYIKYNYPETMDDNILIYEDEGYSGGNTNRPQYQQMVTDIQDKQICTVVCYKLDRISRSVADFAGLYQILEHMNVDFVSVSEKYDTTIPIGRAMMSISTVFAQLERETIAERIRDNMRELAKSGRWLGGHTPTGYKSVKIVGSMSDDGKVRSAFKLDIIKDEAQIIKELFRTFIRTNSLTQTETYFIMNHIKSKNGVSYSRFAIRSILTNPVYMIADEQAYRYFENAGVEVYSDLSAFNGKHGVMAYNKTVKASGNTKKIRDMDEWIIAVGKHKGIITGADWVKVQGMLEQNKPKSFHKPKSNVALLSGLLFCGHCGDYLRPKMSPRYNKDGERIYDYLCQTKEKTVSQNCQMKRPNGNLLDKMVCDAIKNLSEDSSAFFRQLEETKKTIQNSNDDYEKRLTDFRKAFDDNKKQIDKLIQALAKSDESAPAYEYINNQINELHDKNVSIQKSIEEWESIGKSQELSDEAFDALRDMLQSFAASIDTMDVEQKRSTLRMFIKKVIWDGRNIHIILCGSEEPLDFIPPEDIPSDFQPDGKIIGSILPSTTINKSQSEGVAFSMQRAA